MPSPLISVVMPVFNGAPYLGEAVDSILGQSFPGFELIIVDDGSTDESARVPARFRDPRIRVISQAHAGVFTAMNRGIAAAAGEFLARMDADDIARPERLARELEFLRDTGADVAGTCVEVFSAEGKSIPGFKKYEAWTNRLLTHDQIALNIFIEDPIPSPTLFLRRETMERLGGYDEGVYPDDYNLTMKAFRAGLCFGKHPEKLLLWRDHPRRLSRTAPELEDQRFFRLKAAAFAETFPLPGREIVIWGVGKNGKALFRALKEAGRDTAGFTASPEYLGEKSLYGKPVRACSDFHKPFFLLATAARGGRESAARALTEKGFRPGADFIAFC